MLGTEAELGEQRARLGEQQPRRGHEAVEQRRIAEAAPRLGKCAEHHSGPEVAAAVGELHVAEYGGEQRGLAAAVRTDDGDPLARPDLEVDWPQLERLPLYGRAGEARDDCTGARRRGDLETRSQPSHGLSTASSRSIIISVRRAARGDVLARRSTEGADVLVLLVAATHLLHAGVGPLLFASGADAR